MDSHNDLLGELAGDAALERADFSPGRRAAPQVPGPSPRPDRRDRRADPHRRGARLPVVAPDLTFRSRSRYLDEATGEWVSETEVIESASELVELYNPADIYAAFAEAAREAAGLPPEPTAEGDLYETAGIAPDETVSLRRGPVRRGRRLVGGRPADLADRGRRRVGRPPPVRPRPRVPGAEPAQRGAPARGVRGGVGRAHRRSSAT